ncbi:MAG: hypothetical protein K0U37_06640 [Gammaproteobacteria bacterium]|nr:hypothetical protein [Gammaproteobacteria bacterium]
MNKKKLFPAILLAGSAGIASANVCNIEPGSVTCGKGTVTDLSGNGMVTVDGTTINEMTTVNGLLKANNAQFGSLEIHGTASLTQCVINDVADFKGTVTASSSQFRNLLDIYSNLSRFVDTKIDNNIHVHHTDNPKQVVHLEKNSVVSGDIIFDDGHGEVILRGKSTVSGKVIGGEIIYK